MTTSTLLYRAFLGRTCDPESMAAWTTTLEAGGDPTASLAAILQSEEYRDRQVAADSAECTRLADIALARLGRRPRIIDVGAESLGDGSHPYSPLAAMTEIDIVGFDPLAARLDERLASESTAGSLELLPFAARRRSRAHVVRQQLRRHVVVASPERRPEQELQRARESRDRPHRACRHPSARRCPSPWSGGFPQARRPGGRADGAAGRAGNHGLRGCRTLRGRVRADLPRPAALSGDSSRACRSRLRSHGPACVDALPLPDIIGRDGG